MIRRAASAALLLALAPAAALADPPSAWKTKSATERHVALTCARIRSAAEAHALPPPFFARLIWKESRFDPNAVSPAGAEGIAQFMPGTAKLRGLAESFDPARAIPASAAYLAEMAGRYGNLGLAAIGYNAGEGRLKRWMADGGFLPLETENYVLDILGRPADAFAEPAFDPPVEPLHASLSFGAACRAMPALFSRTIAMASVHVKPWGVQVAGHRNRAVAARQWERVRARYGELLKGHEPVMSRLRNARGGIHAVRIGAEGRAEADAICATLRRAGGACVVLKNR